MNEDLVEVWGSKSDEPPSKILKLYLKGNNNFGTQENCTVNYITNNINQSEPPVNPNIIEHLLENIVKSEDNKYFLIQVKEKTIPVKEVETVLVRLKNRTNKLRLQGIVRATVEDWFILKIIKDDDSIKDFLDLLVRELDQEFIQDVFLQKDGEGNSILHYLGSWGKFNVLEHFVDSTCEELDENFNEKLLTGLQSMPIVYQLMRKKLKLINFF